MKEVGAERTEPEREEASVARSEVASPLARVLALQRSAGNAATVQALRLARRKLTEEEKAEDLKSPRYAGIPELQDAYDNSPALKKGKKGIVVTTVQQGLVDAGFPQDKGMRAGFTSGIYDDATVRSVKKFQDRYDLDEDGVVGRQTLGKLDELAQSYPTRKPEFALDEGSIGAHVAKRMIDANSNQSPTSGIYYDYNYFAKVKEDPAAYRWDDDWRSGYASPTHFDKIGYMQWRVKPGVSASEAIKAWISGLTIAECTSTITAIHIDALRAVIGEDAFDARFGSTTVALPDDQRMVVKPGSGGTPIALKLKDTESKGSPGTFGNRNLKVGDWTYFYNHPKYLLKHPGGAWQGENAVYMGVNAAGKQVYSGLGATDKDEDAMHKEMEEAYNADRTGDDYAKLLSRFVPDAPEVKKPSREFLDHDLAYTKGLYEKYKDKIPAIYREDSGEFADQIKAADVLGEPAYEIDGVERKGGLVTDAVYRLDPKMIVTLRPVP